MKNNRIVKIITLALSCLLLVGAVIGISASAEETPAVQIKYKNIAYEGAVQVLYAVEAAGIPDGGKVQMFFYDSNEDTEPRVKDEYTDKALTIGGVTYHAFFSYGIAPKNMRAPIYAKAVIVDAEGAVIAESELSEYSVWQYAVNRFAKSPTPDQEKLYAATLNYGASVQEMLVESKKLTVEEILANGGWANEYCGIKENVTYQGEFKEEGEVAYYAPGTKVTFGTEIVRKIGYANGAIQNYTDAEGNVLGGSLYTMTAKTPGVTEITANYMPATVVELDYEYDEDVNTKYGSGSSSLAALGFKNDKFGTSKTSTGSALIEKDESGNSYLYAQANGLKGGLSTYWQFSSATIETISYDVAFFETDLRWDGYGDDVTALQDAVYFRTYSGGVAADANRNGFVNIQDSGAASDTFRIGLYNKTAVYLPKGEWFNFRLVVTAIGGNKFINEFYINGNLIESIEFSGGDAATASNFVGGTFYTRNAAATSANYSFAIDNTKFGAYTTHAPGNGGMFTDEEAYGTKLGFDSGNIDTMLSEGKAYSKLQDGVLDFKLTTNSTGLGFKKQETTPTVGSTHIVEFDYKFVGANSTTPNANFGWLGLAETGRDKTNHFLPLKWFVGDIDGDEVTSVNLYYGDKAKLLFTLQKDTWYNLRFVYVANNVENADGTVTYKGTVSVYVNNELATTFTTSGYSEGSDKDAEPNRQFEVFGFEFRSTKNSSISNAHMQFDNVYLETVAD